MPSLSNAVKACGRNALLGASASLCTVRATTGTSYRLPHVNLSSVSVVAAGAHLLLYVNPLSGFAGSTSDASKSNALHCPRLSSPPNCSQSLTRNHHQGILFMTMSEAKSARGEEADQSRSEAPQQFHADIGKAFMEELGSGELLWVRPRYRCLWYA
ncbi:hypothetical protein GY45DRAFT_595731 [Cubamyces sp. BRFM 1775]|nr:hypothetical protein GY45DRAFT_595731 [Cubamyces sp. BRFM 1775]